MKRGIMTVIRITKDERNYLVSKGYAFGEDLHSTIGKGRKKTIYATESYKLMKELNKYRNERVISNN